MIRRGPVAEIRGNLIIIKTDANAACFGCMNSECKKNGSSVCAENPKALSLSIGQMVEAEAGGKDLALEAFSALLPPILGFIAGFFLTRLSFPAAGEGEAAGAGVIMLFAAAFAFYRIRKKSPAKSRFMVTRIIE